MEKIKIAFTFKSQFVASAPIDLWLKTEFVRKSKINVWPTIKSVSVLNAIMDFTWTEKESALKSQ